MTNSHTTAKPFIILLCCQKKGEKCAHRISHKSWRKADVNCGWIKNSGTVFLLADSPLVQDWATQSLRLPVRASWRNTPRSGLQIFDWCTRGKVSHLAAKLIPTRCKGGERRAGGLLWLFDIERPPAIPPALACANYLAIVRDETRTRPYWHRIMVYPSRSSLHRCRHNCHFFPQRQ